MELSEHVINFEKRSAAKSQVIGDFIAYWTTPGYFGDGEVIEACWTIHCDGTWDSAGVGIAAIITSPSGIKMRYATRLQFGNETDRCTNNIAEYKAVLLALRKLRALGVKMQNKNRLKSGSQSNQQGVHSKRKHISRILASS